MRFSTPTIRRSLRAVALPAALALTAAGVGHETALAAEFGTLAVIQHQLRFEQSAALRLSAATLNAPASAVRKGTEIAPRLATRRFAKLIDVAARDAALDPALVHAIIHVESRYDPKALSAKGAIGLMQVLPETASRHGVPDPASSPEANLRAGTRYLRYLMEMFDHQVELALAAYNAGEYAVLRHGRRIPPFRETQQYVPAVLAKYREWQEPAPPVIPVTPQVLYLPGTRLDPAAMDTAIYHTTRRPVSR